MKYRLTTINENKYLISWNIVNLAYNLEFKHKVPHFYTKSSTEL